MKHIKKAEGIHKTQSLFFVLGPKKPLGKMKEKKGGVGKIYSPPQTVTALPAQLHHSPGPAGPIRMICLLSFHHPPHDNSGGREQEFQTFGNSLLRVSVKVNYWWCCQTQWPFCFWGLLKYQNGKLCRWTNEGRASQVVPTPAFIIQTVTLLATTYLQQKKILKRH